MTDKNRLSRINLGSSYNWTYKEVHDAIITAFEINNEPSLNLDVERADATNEQNIIAWAQGMGYDAKLIERGEYIAITKRQANA